MPTKKCVSRRAESCGVCWRGTRVLTTVVRSVTGLEGVEAWSRLTRRQLGIIFMVHVPGNSKRRESGEIGDLQWEEKWKAMVSELGKDAKIPNVWRMSALLNIYRRS